MSGLVSQDLRKVHPAHPMSSGDPGIGISSDDWPRQKRLTQWAIIAEKTGVQNTKERLKSYWTTLGVVSALMAALTYPAVTNPAVTRQNSGSGPGTVDDPVFISYVLLNTLSLILSFMVVIISVVLLAEVDLVVTDDDLNVFINRYQHLFQVLTAIFGFSMLVIIASIITGAFFNYSRGTAIATAGICAAGTTIVAILAAWIALWTRARLKVHISEARTLMKSTLAQFRKAVAVRSSSQGQRAVVAAGAAGGGVEGAADESTRCKPSL